MSNENLRNDILKFIYNVVPKDYLQDVANAIDEAISGYDVNKKEVALIPENDNHKMLECYIVSKAVANISMTTLKTYRMHLEKFFLAVNKSYAEITANDIRVYLFNYKDKHKVSDSYLDTIRRNINTFFTWAERNEYVKRNPCTMVEKIKHAQTIREPLTSYQLEELRYACKNIREKAVVDFFFATGVRLSEFRDLNKSDIDWQNHSAIIRHGKGDKCRIVYFNSEAEFSLKKYLASRIDNEDALFVTERKPYKRLSNKAIQDIVKKIGQRVDIIVYPHKFRHTFATTALRSGMILEQLQTLMGHAQPSTTLIYAKIDEDKMRTEHSKAFTN